jgi:hypothetical protein
LRECSTNAASKCADDTGGLIGFSEGGPGVRDPQLAARLVR